MTGWLAILAVVLRAVIAVVLPALLDRAAPRSEDGASDPALRRRLGNRISERWSNA